MEIQKIFSDLEGGEKLYSVLMNEEELSLFSELEQREFGLLPKQMKNSFRQLVRDTKNAFTGSRALEKLEKGGIKALTQEEKHVLEARMRYVNKYGHSPF